MQEQLNKKIDNARLLVNTVHHAAFATTNDDGSPHNSPMYFFMEPDLTTVYWFSNPGALHSRNIERTGQVFIALYRHDSGGGLYIKAEKGRVLAGKELQDALNLHNKLVTEKGGKGILLNKVSGDFPQRMYSANITKLWVNVSTKDEDGDFLNDERVVITKHDLLK